MPAFTYRDEESTFTTTSTQLDDEITPLISTSGRSNNLNQESTLFGRPTLQSNPSLHHRRIPSSPSPSSSSSSSNLNLRDLVFHSSDESGNWLLDFIMEKVKNTKIGYLADRLAVESEPGLTNAQLMLNNHDLKPGSWSILSTRTSF